mmetsp:Transcript_29650/g.86377  ORF Transcript_29650/g.86377 Transcript_29650/m.86377 type:complete len:235 (-) Transcript_29650:3006-3710(-)
MVHHNDGDDGDSPLVLRLIDETLNSYLRRADKALRVGSISRYYLCGLDWANGDSICGADKCWDDDNTLATAYTACTACTDYTGYTNYTDGTFRTEVTGGTYGTYHTYESYGTYETTEKGNGIIESVEEEREESEEIGAKSFGHDGDDATVDETVVAANRVVVTTKVPPIVIEVNTKKNSIPWKDYSCSESLATEITEEDYCMCMSPKNAKKGKEGIVSKRVKRVFASGLRKQQK